MKIYLLLLSFTLYIITGCSKAGNEHEVALSVTDKNFADGLLPLMMNTLKASELASLKSTRSEVKTVAATLHAETKPAYDTFTEILKGLNYPPQLPADSNLIRDQLMAFKARSFDSAYLAWQVRQHKKTISVFKKRIANEDQTLLRAYAVNYISMLNSQLTKVESAKW